MTKRGENFHQQFCGSFNNEHLKQIKRNNAVVQNLITGATGVAACFGSDFVKVNDPEKQGYKSREILKELFCLQVVQRLYAQEHQA